MNVGTGSRWPLMLVSPRTYGSTTGRVAVDRHDLTWLAWATATAASFGLLERRALRQHTPTLTRTVRKWTGASPANYNRSILRVLLGAALGWLAWDLLGPGER